MAPQALTLFNGDFVNRQARHLAVRLVKEAGDEPSMQVDRAFLLALCRTPTPGERSATILFLEEEARGLGADPAPVAPDGPIGPGAARLGALEQLCRVIFNSNEFVYAD